MHTNNVCEAIIFHEYLRYFGRLQYEHMFFMTTRDKNTTIPRYSGAPAHSSLAETWWQQQQQQTRRLSLFRTSLSVSCYIYIYVLGSPGCVDACFVFWCNLASGSARVFGVWKRSSSSSSINSINEPEMVMLFAGPTVCCCIPFPTTRPTSTFLMASL